MYELPGPEDQWVKAFLTVRTPLSEPLSWVSSFNAAVRDARQATGRDLTTGHLQDPVRAGSWLGTLGYLVLLDLIGECFRPTHSVRTPVSSAPVVKALTHFGGSLTDDEILAIYALRCALAHDYGLTNIGEGRLAQRLTHAFALTNDDETPVVAEPSVRWDGNLLLAGTRRTVINLRALGNLIEDLVRKVQSMHEDGAMEIALDDGANELFARFAFHLR